MGSERQNIKEYARHRRWESLAVSVFFVAFWMASAWPSDQNQPNPPISLAECERIGFENHKSIRLAKEEVGLAASKRQEALRAIFPNLTLKGEETEGKAVQQLGTPDFMERNYGVQLAQPVFQGGKLYRTFLQSQANWRSARAKLAKSEQEVLFHVRETFWNLVKARRTQEIYAQALSDLTKEKTVADKLLQNDVITPQVYMTINSQYNQAAYLLESAEAELGVRLWQWAAALGLKEPAEFRPNYNAKPNLQEKISLDECLSLARSNHPDILIQKSAMEAALSGSRIARSYLWPQLDFNAFYGKSGAAFKGENLELREDWQVGLRLAFYFGGNSTQVSALRQRTSPKIGQSSRTESQTVSVSVGLLDGFKNRSESKEASLLFHQAETQLELTEMEVSNGARESYANWKKALAQLKIAENDLALALTEQSVAEIKSSHRESPISERSVARNKLAQAEVSLTEAQSAYSVSLASLNRAVGIANHFKLVGEP